MDKYVKSTFEKIRFTASYFVYEIIEKDSKDFNISFNSLCNKITEIYYLKPLKKYTELEEKHTNIIQFNLTVNNTELKEIIKNKITQTQTEAELYLSMFFQYCLNPQYKREQIIFDSIYSNIKRAIKLKEQITIKFKEQTRIIEPYFITNYETEANNYIYCYCYNNNNYVVYKLSTVKDVKLNEIKQNHRNDEQIKLIRENFDPYLSYGHKVIVKFTEKGLKMLDKFKHNKPKLFKNQEEKSVAKSNNKKTVKSNNENNNIIVFECSDLKAKLFFPGFFNEAEILEPIELRNYFKEKALKMFELYNN